MSDLIAEIEFECVNGEIDRRLAGRIITALRALPAVQPDTKPKPFDCECGQVGPCKAQFCTPRSAQPHVNETPKSEHETQDMLTPATKRGDA